MILEQIKNRRLSEALRHGELEQRRHADVPQCAPRAEHGGVYGSIIVHGRVQGEEAHALTGQGQRLAVGIAVDRVRIDRGQERHLHPAVDQLAVRLVGNDVDRVAVPAKTSSSGRHILKNAASCQPFVLPDF